MQRRERFGDNGNLVRRDADRPAVETVRVSGPGAKIVGEVVAPMTEFKVVRRKTMGGGTSREALRRARRRVAANGVS